MSTRPDAARSHKIPIVRKVAHMAVSQHDLEGMLPPPAVSPTALERLFAVIRERQAHPREGSYTCRLLAQGSDKVAKKVGEEAIEVVLAACGQGPARLLSESADLVYHLMVLLAANNLTLDDLYRELEERMT